MIRRCITIGTSIVQGPALIETRRIHQTGKRETTGYATIDGKRGKLIPQVRKGTRL